MASYYSIDLAPVGPEQYSGWSPYGNYIVGRYNGQILAVWNPRKGSGHQILLRTDSVRDAKSAVQAHATQMNATKGRG